ncbi:hypothetical protein [Methylobacterium sp. NFXW15]|uniref:hypothetical protein n=1 Tax=Methylobacterium sp. NFXW15 TaxID=2819512 RepID=UPI003CF80C0B
MDEVPALAAQDAAEALIALGWPVLPHGPDMDLWQIGDLIWTNDELMGLAARHGVQVSSGPHQASIGRLQ